MAITPAMTGMSGMSGMTGGFSPLSLGTNLRQYTLDGGLAYETSELDGIPVLRSLESYSTYRQPRQGRAYLFDGINDVMDVGATGKTVTQITFTVKLAVDDQQLFTLQDSTATAVTVVASVLTFGGSLTVSAITVDGVSKTAGQAGVLLNDNAWHTVVLTLSAISVSDLNIGCDSTAGAFGNFSMSKFSLGASDADGLWVANEESGLVAYDSSGNGNHGTLTSITQSTFHATDTGVTSNPANEVGHTNTAGVIIPRDESDPANDVLGAALQYTGKSPFPVQVNTPVATFDGVNDTATLASSVTLGTNATVVVQFEKTSSVLDADCLTYDQAGGSRIEHNGPSNLVRIRVGTGAIKDFAATLAEGTVYQIAVTKTGTSYRVYVDGTESSTGALTATGTFVISDIGFGFANAFFTGPYHWIKVYDHVLTSDELDGTTDPGDPELLALTFQEGAGNVVYDVSGNGKHGTITNAVISDFWAATTNESEDHSINYGGGHVGFFDGSTAFNRAAFTDVSAYPFSFSAWVKAPSTAARRIILWMGDSSADNALATIGIDASGNAELGVANGGATDYITGGTAIDDDTWYHIAGIFRSATDREIYVDGTTDGTDATSVLVPTIDRVTVGSHDGATPATFWSGMVRDARVYSDELTTGEITYLANDGDSGDDPGTANLVAQYLLDGNPDDSSSGGNDGATSGTTYAFVPALLSAATLPIGGTPAATRVAGKFGNANSSINFNPYSAAELNAIVGLETAALLGVDRSAIATIDTKFSRVDTDGDDRFFAVVEALTGADLAAAELYTTP